MFPVSLSVCGRESLKEQLEPCRDDDATGTEAVFVPPENRLSVNPSILRHNRRFKPPTPPSFRTRGQEQGA